METVESLADKFTSLYEMVKSQSKIIEAQKEILEITREQIKDAPTLELIVELGKRDVEAFNNLRDKAAAAIDVCSCRIDLAESINNILIDKILSLINKEEKVKLASQIKAKYSETIAGFLRNESFSEESKVELRKLAESGMSMFIVK